MLWLAVAAATLIAPAAASAASVAYIDGGNVWVSSLDGTQKHRLTGDGFWREVAQSDGGRIVGVRRLDGQSAKLATIALWEANGSKAFDGFLPAPGGWQLYAYPLSVDVSADGKFLVYGYSNSSYNPLLFPNPYTFERGHYLTSLSGPTILDPLKTTDKEWPTFAGLRVVANSGGQVAVQKAAVAPAGSEFDPWLNPIPGYDLGRTDVAANGRIAALEMNKYDNSTQTAGFIDMTPVNALGDTNVPPGSCILPTQGFAKNVTLLQDATRVAWEDQGGVWIAGAPNFPGNGPPSSVPGNTTCVLTAPPVLISATGTYPSIGGANVADMIPAPAPAPVGPGATPTVLSVKLPASTPIAALRKGLAVRVGAPRAGLVTVTATVPGKRLGLRGAAARRPALIAKGTARVAAARVIAVKLKLTALGRAKSARLKGAKATVRIKLGTKVLTRTLRLR
jgi:hypothetical protein